MSIFKLARLFQFKMALASEEIEAADLSPINLASNEDEGSVVIMRADEPQEMAISFDPALLAKEDKDNLRKELREIIKQLDKYIVNNEIFSKMAGKNYYLTIDEEGLTKRTSFLPEFPRAARAVELLNLIKRDGENLYNAITDADFSIEKTVRPAIRLLDSINKLKEEDSDAEVTTWKEKYKNFANLAELYGICYPPQGAYSAKANIRTTRHSGLGGRSSIESIAMKREFSKLTEWLSDTERHVRKMIDLYQQLNRKDLTNNPQTKKDISSAGKKSRHTSVSEKEIRKQETHEIEKALDIYESVIGKISYLEFMDLCKIIYDGNTIKTLSMPLQTQFMPAFSDIPTEDLLRHAFTEWRLSPQRKDGEPPPPGIPFSSYSVREQKVVTKYVNSPLVMSKLAELKNRIQLAKELKVERDKSPQYNKPEMAKKYLESMPPTDRDMFNKLPIPIRIKFYNGEISTEKLSQILEQARETTDLSKITLE